MCSTWYLECDQVSAGDVGLLSEYIDTDSEKEQLSLMQALDLYYLAALISHSMHAQETYYLKVWSDSPTSIKASSSSASFIVQCSAGSCRFQQVTVINVKLRGVLEHPEPLAGYATEYYVLNFLAVRLLL